MGDSIGGHQGCESSSSSGSKTRLSYEDSLASYAIIQETSGARRLHHTRTRSTGHGGSTLSLNSSSYHKFCNHSVSPVSTPKISRHEFFIGAASLHRDNRMVRSVGSATTPTSSSTSTTTNNNNGSGGSTSSGYHSKPNSPVPGRRSLTPHRCDHQHHHHHHHRVAHHTQNHSDHSDNSSHMSSSSSGGSTTSAAAAVTGNKGQKVKKGNCSNSSSNLTASFVPMNSNGSGERRSVHKQNLYIVSYPIILLFNIFRSLLYQLFVLLRYVYCAAQHRRQQHYAEVQKRRRQVAEADQKQKQNTLIVDTTAVGGEITAVLLDEHHNNHHHHHQYHHLSQLSAATAVETSTEVNNNIDGATNSESVPLVMNSPRFPPGPGPADPLLAKQKHHHRRAFEYISKALKIDEENEGECKKVGFYRRRHSGLLLQFKVQGKQNFPRESSFSTSWNNNLAEGTRMAQAVHRILMVE